jgi:microcystin-dependent protein
MYGAGDGSTTFSLPNYKGYFLRGWDNGAGMDPDAATRTDRGDGTTGDNVGTKQADKFASHGHTVFRTSSNASGEYASGTGFRDILIGDRGGTAVTNNVDSVAFIGLTGGNESRSKNINVLYCIKY